MISSRPDNFHKEHNFREGPLAAYAQQFRAHLESQQYRKATIYDYLMRVDAFSQLLKQREIDIRNVDESQVEGLLKDTEAACLRGKFPLFIIKSCIRFLCSLGVAKPLAPAPPDESARGRLRAEWEGYLRRQRGVSEKTIKNAWWLVSQFLKFRFGEEDGNLQKSMPQTSPDSCSKRLRAQDRSAIRHPPRTSGTSVCFCSRRTEPGRTLLPVF